MFKTESKLLYDVFLISKHLHGYAGSTRGKIVDAVGMTNIGLID